MSVKGFKNHPYIPNSVPEVEQEMLHELGLNSLEELHAEVPDEIILKREMDLPEAFGSEYELRRHVEGVLKKTCADNLNFLGAGCWQHYVPALCDEINGKGEFVTAYGGESYNDFGRFQSLFKKSRMAANHPQFKFVFSPFFTDKISGALQFPIVAFHLLRHRPPDNRSHIPLWL